MPQVVYFFNPSLGVVYYKKYGIATATVAGFRLYIHVYKMDLFHETTGVLLVLPYSMCIQEVICNT